MAVRQVVFAGGGGGTGRCRLDANDDDAVTLEAHGWDGGLRHARTQDLSELSWSSLAVSIAGVLTPTTPGSRRLCPTRHESASIGRRLDSVHRGPHVQTYGFPSHTIGRHLPLPDNSHWATAERKLACICSTLWVRERLQMDSVHGDDR